MIASLYTEMRFYKALKSTKCTNTNRTDSKPLKREMEHCRVSPESKKQIKEEEEWNVAIVGATTKYQNERKIILFYFYIFFLMALRGSRWAGNWNSNFTLECWFNYTDNLDMDTVYHDFWGFEFLIGFPWAYLYP